MVLGVSHKRLLGWCSTTEAQPPTIGSAKTEVHSGACLSFPVPFRPLPGNPVIKALKVFLQIAHKEMR